MKPKDSDYLPIFGFPITQWHRRFAWYPVHTVDYGVVWLRPVWQRRCQLKGGLFGDSMWWQRVVDSQYAIGEES